MKQQVSAVFSSLLLTLLLAIVGGLSAPLTALGQSETDAGAACYTDLLSESAAIPSMASVYTTFAELSYDEVRAGLSNSYNNYESFGLSVDKPVLTMRVASFGAQTGYQHPPYTPFPSTQLSDKWEEPAKEHIYVEEYVTNPDGQKVLMNCAFFSVASPDLQAVTAERYLYDGNLTSFFKRDADKVVWYNANDSFDVNGINFVSWKRLFVIPKSGNDYFDRYEVSGTLPGLARATNEEFAATAQQLPPDREVALLGIRERVIGAATEFIETEETVTNAPTEQSVPTSDESGATDIANSETEVEFSYSDVFPFYDMFQAIEDRYPEFATNLSLRGVLSFENFKYLLANPEQPELLFLWSTIVDSRAFTLYAQAKTSGEIYEEDPVFDYVLNLVNTQTLDADLANTIAQIQTDQANAAAAEMVPQNEDTDSFMDTLLHLLMNLPWYIWSLVGAVVVAISFLIYKRS